MIESSAVIIVNYNSPDYALAALASAWGAAHFGGGLKKGTRLILVDNGSTDKSAERFVDVLTGQKPAAVMEMRPGVEYLLPPPEAVRFVTSTKGRVRADQCDAPVTVVLANQNRGFASGCNIGLRLVGALGLDMAILLNPDAVMTATTIRAFADAFSENEKLGLAGATIRHHDAPYKLQAAGGAKLSSWTLLGQNQMEGMLLEALPEGGVEIDYPHGAAMAVSAAFLKEVGFMDEQHFLYYEEADWAAQGGDNWTCKWVRGASVFHHRGIVTQSHNVEKSGTPSRSPLSDYHMIRSRMIFASKWHQSKLGFLYVASLLQALRRVMRGQKAQAKAVLDGVREWQEPQSLEYKPALPIGLEGTESCASATFSASSQ